MKDSSINIYFYNDFYKKNKSALYHFILKMIHDPLVAEELVDDVFVNVYKAMNTFDESKSQFKTWVYNIAKNATIDYVRKKKLDTQSMYYDYQLSDNTFEEKEKDFTSIEKDPLDLLINSEEKGKITEALHELKPLQAEILTQYAYGYTYDEIAADLHMPIGTVKATMHSARKRMQEIFKRIPVAV